MKNALPIKKLNEKSLKKLRTVSFSFTQKITFNFGLFIFAWKF